MEVLYRPCTLYVNQPALMYPPSLHQVFPSPADVYTCYPFETNLSPRTPPSEYPCRTYAKHMSNMEVPHQKTTLHSVLKGRIPPTYSHLMASPPSSKSSLTSTFPSQNFCMEFDSLNPVLSPSPSRHSSLSYSPRPQSNESHTSHDSTPDPQTEPMDLSCKRLSRKRTAISAFLDVATTNNKDSVLSSSISIKHTKQRASSSEFLSTSSSCPLMYPTLHSFPASPAEGQGQNGEFSLLRNLLIVGKHHLSLPETGSVGLSNSTPNLSSSRACNSPASDTLPRTSISGNTNVQLAKKNLFPVSARVSDWLVKIVQFTKSIPEFSSLSHNDKITLVLNSWTRLMLLYMAESNFQFAVTPIPTMDLPAGEVGPAQDEPTMKTVEGLQTFIRKCQLMSVDSKEYEFLRMLVLFNAGYSGLSCPETIDNLNSVVQQLLQQHVRVSRPTDVMHYSRLLMCLPALYGTNSRMFQALFCKHITKTTDMEVLLKELFQSIS